MGQSWQVGICWECAEESRPVPAMACPGRASEDKTGSAKLGRVTEEFAGPPTRLVIIVRLTLFCSLQWLNLLELST